MAGGHELVLAAARVDEEHVGVAGLTQGQGLASADGDNVYASIKAFLKRGQDGVKQAGIGRAGGGRQPQYFGLTRATGRQERNKQHGSNAEQQAAHYVSSYQGRYDEWS
jgi:hypothetical protein